VAAGIAVQAQESVDQDAAVQIGAQFALYEAGDRRALLARAREKALEVLSNDLVEQCLLGLMALVLDGAMPSRDRVLMGRQQDWCRLDVHSSSRVGEGAETSSPFGEVFFGRAYEGAPGCVHGGYVAAVFGEAPGMATVFSGRLGMTDWIKVSCRKPIPVETSLRGITKTDDLEGRKIRTSAELLAGDLMVARATGLARNESAIRHQCRIDL